MTTVKDALTQATQMLTVPSIDNPFFQAEKLLQFVLNVSRTTLHLDSKRLISQNEYDRYINVLILRLNEIPLQYIIGSADFWGNEFGVREGVFIPRFDSEVIVDHAINFIKSKFRDTSETIRALDMCCGSGALGLSIAKELPNVFVSLIDFSHTSVHCASENATKLCIKDRVTIKFQNLLTGFPRTLREPFQLIVANPPYISMDEIIELSNEVVYHEPLTALTDLSDGLTFYRRWAELVPTILHKDGLFITEIGFKQAESVSEILSERFVNKVVLKDLSGNDRAIKLWGLV